MSILGWSVVVAVGFVAVVFVVDWLTDDGDPDFHSETDSNIGKVGERHAHPD